jgi:hypothetical protein
VPNPILDLAAQFRMQALQRERVAATQLVRAYGQVYRNLDPQIRALEESLRGLENPRPVDIQRLSSLRVLKQQTVEQVNRYAAYADTTIAGQVQANIAVGLRDSEALVQANFDPAWLRENGLVLNTDVQKALRASWVRVPNEAVETMVGMTQPDSPLRQALVHNLGDVVAQQMVDALVLGIATGKNPRVIARQAMGAGLNYSLTTARTAQLWAYREATRANYMANRDIVSGWKWSASLSSRTCASCLAMHGTVHPVDEPLNDHHNGRCSAIPIVPLAAKLGIPEPDMGDAETWLKAQPESVQEEMLGKGVYEGYKGGKWGLKDLSTTYEDGVYGTMRRPPTLEMLNERAAAVVAPVARTAQGDRVVEMFSGDKYREFKNIGQIDKFGSYYEPWANGLAQEERAALVRYQEVSFGDINMSLRGQASSAGNYQADIAQLDSAMGKAQIPHNAIVYRGLKGMPNLQVGDSIMDSGFVSTTCSRDAAENYLHQRAGDTLFEVKVKRGQSGLYMDAVSSKEEYELLLPRGSQFRITGQRADMVRGNPITIFEMEIE